ncbi:MAG: UvrD-helicase domain-containing protein [Bryobacteraceae bacterium]
MISDELEREKALDPTCSFIVEAPAGSGKTGVLIQRYLRLLGGVERPESVVAITFTRKAAGEIKDRVLKALRDANQDSAAEEDEYEKSLRELAHGVLKRDREKHWNLLDDPSRLQIQTIDALCAMLTRQMPVVSRFGGLAQVLESPNELYHLAARRALSDLTVRGEDLPALFRRVSLHFDNDVSRLEGQVARMLERRDQWENLSGDSHPQLVQDFCRLLDFAEHSLEEVFRERGQVDFTEVTRAAIRALGTPDRPSDLLYSLDYRIEHLLVDEFQDTSRSQYALLKALTEQWSEDDGHTLFLVGDPLQSIYRFREAEIALFLQSWNEKQLGSVRLNPIRLTTNFRSTPEIVEWTVKIFDPIMSTDDPAHGGVKLRPSCASRSKSHTGPKVIPFIEDKGEEEAKQVVKLVKQALPKGQVAILVRSRTHVVSILPALRAAGITYEAVEIDALKEEQHVLDLISLTRAVLHLGDRLSWLACLRAPWCGLTVGDLSLLAENERDRTILDLLSDPQKIASLSADGRSRAVRVQEILFHAVAHAGRVPLRDLVEQTWVRLGGPAILHQSNHLEDADTFFSLLENFEQGGIIRDFSLLNERLEYLFARPAADADRVQVLTIHKAKGLEFDTVILPQLGTGARRSDHDLLIWTEQIGVDNTKSLLIAAQPQTGASDRAYDHICEEIKVKEEHELKRLFYVAATRAKNELYLLGSTGTKNNRSECKKAASNTFLGLIWNSVEPLFESERRRKSPVQTTLFAAQDEAPKTILHRLPANWRAPRLDSSVHWQPELRRATASARTVTYEWVSDTGRHAGTVVHEMLKRITREGTTAWGTERLGKLAPMIKSELLRLGVAASEEPEASARVLRALNNTLASERGQWILRPHPETRSEWPLAGRLQDKLISGTVDRIFRDEEDRLWIIDYKTGEHEGGRLEAFLKREQRRYQAQLDTYAALMSRIAKGPIWLGLYFPLLDGWREWRFEEEVALSANYTGL